MKKTLLLILIAQFSVIGNSFSQSKAMIYLNRYAISLKHKEIRVECIRPANKISKIVLSGPDARYFKAGKGNTLVYRGTKTGKKWFDLSVSAQTEGGVVKEDYRIVSDQFNRNKVIAHRGAFKNTGSPENSIASLNHAIAMGCEGSEFDVHLSSDSVLFVNHDDKIQGLEIEKTPASRLSEVKLPNGESLPTLEQFLKAGTRQNKTRLILEIKPSAISSERGIALTHKVLEMVRDFKAEGWVDYIGFDYDICKEIIKLAPYAKVAYLKGDKSPAEVAADGITGLDYHFSVFQKNPDWIKEAKQKKLTVNVWTVNEEKLMDWLISEKVDFITTNEPELLLKKQK